MNPPTLSESAHATQRTPSDAAAQPHRLSCEQVGAPFVVERESYHNSSTEAIEEQDRTAKEQDTAKFEAHEQLIQHKGNDHVESDRGYVQWGISWDTPTIIILWALGGLAWAVAHHIYYSSLDGQLAGSSPRQAWAIRAGTLMAFLSAISFKAACDTVYKQYIWTIFKRQDLSLHTVDKIFAVTSDPAAFASWEFWRKAKLAFCVAIICWCLPLAGIAPPATLSVTTGSQRRTISSRLASLDWGSPAFSISDKSAASPASEVLRIATLSGQSMAVIPPQLPAANSSFHLHFFGPSLQCNAPDTSRQQSFDKLTSALASNESLILTKDWFESGNINWTTDTQPMEIQPVMNVYSAFAPLPDYTQSQGDTAQWYSVAVQTIVQESWIQLSDQAIVCTLGNASFDVEFEFKNAILTTASYQVSDFEPLQTPNIGENIAMLEHNESYVGPNMYPNVTSSGRNYWNPMKAYIDIFLATTSLLNGNVSTTLSSRVVADYEPFEALNMRYRYGVNNTFDGNVTMNDASSRVLQTGLSACDEFVNGYWSGDGAIGIGAKGPVPWREATTETYSMKTRPIGVSPETFTKIKNDLFTKPAWMCRNRTLARAIEDLANNITISMLSSPDLIQQNATLTDVHISTTHNIYSYEPRNLWISYGIAILLTLLCVIVGLFALHYNGVAHSNAFSAIIATTRNQELDEVSRGHSLGAYPLGDLTMKMRFGVLDVEGRRERKCTDGDSSDDAEIFEIEKIKDRERRVGFGRAERVGKLRRGGAYT